MFLVLLKQPAVLVLVVLLFLLALCCVLLLLLRSKEKREFQERVAILGREKEEVERLEALRSDFITHAAADLKTPLAGVIGIAESLVDGAGGRISDKTAENLDSIVAGCRKLLSLVDDILDIEQLRKNLLKLQLNPFDLRALVDVLIEFLGPSLAARGVSLQNRVPAEVPLVMADPGRMRQMIATLVFHVVSRAGAGCVSIGAEAVPGAGTGGLVRIRIVPEPGTVPTGRGSGIFGDYQSPAGGASDGVSSLELDIVRKLVDLHGGSLTLADERGAGCSLELPLYGQTGERAAILTGAAEVERVKRQIERLSWNGMESRTGLDRRRRLRDRRGIIWRAGSPGSAKILIADNDLMNLRLMINNLEMNGFDTDIVANGGDVLGYFASNRAPDLIIASDLLPGLSGYEVCRRVRERYTPDDLPILLLADRQRGDDVVRGYEAGANDYLFTPIDKNELLARVRTLLALRRSLREREQVSFVEHELNIARAMQRAILPEAPPRMPGLDVAVKYYLTPRVGGDYYDFLAIGGEKLGIVIADVSGHGIPSVLIGGMIKTAFSFMRDYAGDAARVMAGINAAIHDKLGNNFLTATYSFIDLERGTLTNARAGHPPVLVYKRSEGIIHSLNPAGRLIAGIPGFVCDSLTIGIVPGDRVILYTDGIFEIADQSGELFGEERLLTFIREKEMLPCGEFADELVRTLSLWSQARGFEDDITLIVIDVLGPDTGAKS